MSLLDFSPRIPLGIFSILLPLLFYCYFIHRSKEWIGDNIIDNLVRSGRFRMAKYLLHCGYVISFEPWVEDFNESCNSKTATSRNDKINKFIKLAITHGEEVPTLSLCCRKAIRSHLLMCSGGTSIKQTIVDLRLPTSMSRFLDFQNECEEYFVQR